MTKKKTRLYRDSSLPPETGIKLSDLYRRTEYSDDIPKIKEIFFGTRIPDICTLCTHLQRTDKMHGYCTFTDCKVGVNEFNRRYNKKTTSGLEKSYSKKNNADIA